MDVCIVFLEIGSGVGVGVEWLVAWVELIEVWLGSLGEYVPRRPRERIWLGGVFRLELAPTS